MHQASLNLQKVSKFLQNRASLLCLHAKHQSLCYDQKPSLTVPNMIPDSRDHSSKKYQLKYLQISTQMLHCAVECSIHITRQTFRVHNYFRTVTLIFLKILIQ